MSGLSANESQAVSLLNSWLSILQPVKVHARSGLVLIQFNSFIDARVCAKMFLYHGLSAIWHEDTVEIRA
jgi:hypothetical protein